MTNWSEQIRQRYCCEISTALANWFDSEVWRHTSLNEYRHAVSPSDLLSDAPDSIWPALMPYHLLPLLGNDDGDWLCLSFDDTGAANEIVQWYHGGGDWIPWGRDFPEAIIYDRVRHFLPGPKRSHAVPAVQRGPEMGSLDDPYLRWANQFLSVDAALLSGTGQTPAETAASMLDHGIAEVAVRCDLLQQALDHPLVKFLTPEVARNFQIDWNEANEWMFDVTRIPDDISAQLHATFPSSVQPDAQDWHAAAEHCEATIAISPELAWPWDILGYCHLRAGHNEDAIEAFREGSTKSVFTDQSVRLRTHWLLNRSAKFSSAQLASLAPNSFSASDYYPLLVDSPTRNARRSVVDFWINRAEESALHDDHKDRLDAYSKAGWDLGAEPMERYVEILTGIESSAKALNRPAIAALAATHRHCLQSRYGLG